MGSDDLHITLAAIRAVAQRSASISLSEGTPRSRGASPASSLRGVSSESTCDSVASRSAPIRGSTDESPDSGLWRPPRPKSAGHLGIIQEVPCAPLPSPVQLAVQQTVEFAAAVTMPWDTQRAPSSPRRPDCTQDDDEASSEGGSQEIDTKNSAPKGKSKNPARFQEIVNRLHSTAEQYQHNRQQRQQQKAQNEAEALSQTKPMINKRSAHLARNIEPLAVRTEKRKAQLEKKHENERLKKVEQELEEIKACPTINQKSQEICREARIQGISSQYQWDKERRQRLEVEQEQRKEEELKDCTFKPQLSAMSEKLSRQTSLGGDVHERLHRQAWDCKHGNRHNEASVGSVDGSYPQDAERSRVVTQPVTQVLSQGPTKAVSFEDFMGLEPPSAASAIPRSSTCFEERAPATPQAIPRQPSTSAKRRPNPLTKGLISLQEEQQHQKEAAGAFEELRWEDEQEAVNRTVRYLANGGDPHWEEDEVPRMTPRYHVRHHNVMDEYEEDPGKEERSPDWPFDGSPVVSALRDVEYHGTKAMSFESFMMGASLGHQLDREDASAPLQSPVMEVGRPLCSTSSFLPADIGCSMGCAAELNVVEYNDRFLDIFSAITGEVRT